MERVAQEECVAVVLCGTGHLARLHVDVGQIDGDSNEFALLGRVVEQSEGPLVAYSALVLLAAYYGIHPSVVPEQPLNVVAAGVGMAPTLDAGIVVCCTQGVAEQLVGGASEHLGLVPRRTVRQCALQCGQRAVGFGGC